MQRRIFSREFKLEAIKLIKERVPRDNQGESGATIKMREPIRGLGT
jgi:transposase-like protein